MSFAGGGSPINEQGAFVGNGTAGSITRCKIVITQSCTIVSGENGNSGGPISLADGVTVTVADGSAWSIV